ncbi:hypothetical protein H671_2g5991 [Cricetulus griseus]|uniref:Uncharacterized protein n=1 Tax=Cricetulus griseus TaxID=10029 RepID=A0A061IIZ2_CRIGR|nr:hypothetical protein H671_2g5991 [Cricetulus griseus]
MFTLCCLVSLDKELMFGSPSEIKAPTFNQKLNPWHSRIEDLLHRGNTPWRYSKTLGHSSSSTECPSKGMHQRRAGSTHLRRHPLENLSDLLVCQSKAYAVLGNC